MATAQLSGQFFMQIVLGQGDKQVTCVAYDKACRELLGCTAELYDQLNADYPIVSSILEESLCNRLCRVELKEEQESKSPGLTKDRVINCIDVLGDHVPLFEHSLLAEPRRLQEKKSLSFK